MEQRVLQVLPGFFLGLPDQAEAVVGGRGVLVTGEDAGVPPLRLGHLTACQERVGVLDKLACAMSIYPNPCRWRPR